MSYNKKTALFFCNLIPTNLISRIMGIIARVHFPEFLLNIFINLYCSKFNVNRDEYETPENGFKNIDMFFTRKLKNGIHKIDRSESSIVSPVDGRIDQFGIIDNTEIMQAKGINYSLRDLIPSDSAERFKNGNFITIYLSPSDYHRIHSPVKGIIEGYFNIPGRLFTVQDHMVKKMKGLFSVNERIISYIKTECGHVAVCKIGATGVGRISLSYTDIETNRLFRKRSEIFFSEGQKSQIASGDELGIFHLGSTVILLFQNNIMSFDSIKTGDKVRMGERIGYFI